NEVEPRSRRLEEANRPMINIYFPKQVEERMQLLIDQLKVQNAAHERIRRSTYCPTPFEQPKMEDFLDGPTKIGLPMTDMDFTVGSPFADVWSQVLSKNAQKKFWELSDIVYSFEYMKSFQFVQDMR
ncbi:hypothetical protein PENTCL1PPCAC_9502, partial [Pristionchus entomophagus]